MRGGAVLIFDEPLDAAVRVLWDLVAEIGGPGARSQGIPPHITLLGADGLEPNTFAAGLAEVALRHAAFPLYLGAVATFFGPGGVVYLAPSVTPALATLQHEVLTLALRLGASPWPDMLPGQWMAHCTLDVGLCEDTVSRTMAAVHGQCTGLEGRAIALAIFMLTDDGVIPGAVLPLGHTAAS